MSDLERLIALLKVIRSELWNSADGNCVCGHCQKCRQLVTLIDDNLRQVRNERPTTN